MRPTALQYAQALDELTAEGDEKAASLAKNLFDFLRRRGEGDKSAAILGYLEKMEADKKGMVSVTVITAHAVSPDAKQSLLARAEKLFPKKKIELHYEVDENVIGGARFRTDEVLYDTTLSNELQIFKKSLTK